MRASARRRFLLGGLIVAVLITGLATWLVKRPSASDRSASRLAELGAPLPGLPAVGKNAHTSPSCEAFRSCVSASSTWQLANQATRFASVVLRVDQWAARRGLHDVVWNCGPQAGGPFGTRAAPGCLAGFSDGNSDESVFVAVTFEQAGFPSVSATWDGTKQVAGSAELGAALVRTISTQVVVGVGRIE